MFTGIITDLGTVRSVEPAAAGRDTRLVLETAYDTATIEIGTSIACSGACLTVVETGPGWFAIEVSGETLRRTPLGDWREGTRVNLERSLRAGDELGGHIVTGHVDGLARVVEKAADGGSQKIVFEAPEHLMGFIAVKGSVALDGVSLTVNDVEGNRFGVNIIPHTQLRTTLGERAPGDSVGLEVDVLARYVARRLETE